MFKLVWIQNVEAWVLVVWCGDCYSISCIVWWLFIVERKVCHLFLGSGEYLQSQKLLSFHLNSCEQREVGKLNRSSYLRSLEFPLIEFLWKKWYLVLVKFDFGFSVCVCVMWVILAMKTDFVQLEKRNWSNFCLTYY